MIDIEIFKDIGLTSREIKVYISLLELGSTSIGRILEKTQIPSSKIYEILSRLENKGLVSHVKIENKRYYQAADPKSVLTFLDDKRKKISEIMPELLEKQKFAGKKQSVEIYEGKKAIFNMLRNIIENSKPKDLFLAFTHGKHSYEDETINIFYKSFIKRREDKKLDTRLLANLSNKQFFKNIYTKKEFQEAKIRFTNFDFPKGMTIFGDNILIVSWRENPTAIKINSQSLAEDFKNFFLQLWKIGET